MSFGAGILVSGDGRDEKTLAVEPKLADVQRRQWSESAVWNYWDMRYRGFWEQACGQDFPIYSVEKGMSCALEAMRLAGASREAIDFFSAYGYFLVEFQELGTIDYGRGSNPWVDMGRPGPPLLLNGIPGLIDTGDLAEEFAEGLRTATPGQVSIPSASYADLLRREPSVLAWPTYAKVVQVGMNSIGGQTFVVDVPLLVCRSCPLLGYMPVVFEFTAGGTPLPSYPTSVPTSTRMLPFKPP